MAAKHHCIICGNLIYGGMYCSSCAREIGRTRTLDEESLEEWIERARTFRAAPLFPREISGRTLDFFFRS